MLMLRGWFLVVPALVQNDETAHSALKKQPTRPIVIQAEVPGKAPRMATDSTEIGGRREEASALYCMVLVALKRAQHEGKCRFNVTDQ